MFSAYTIAAFMIGLLLGFRLGQIARRGEPAQGLSLAEQEADYAQANPQLPANEVPALILRDLIGANGIAPTEAKQPETAR